MRIDLMTLFPEMCEAVLGESIIGRARQAGKVDLRCVNFRDFTLDKHGHVDDAPYGGGMGMILSPQPIFDCYQSLYDPAREEKPHLIYLSPKGAPFTQRRAVELAQLDRLVLLCGHYEGVDERLLDEIVDEELSIGDFVVTGGELPALLVADAVCRMLPGVLADAACFEEESHFTGLLEYPQYTRPPVWRDRAVPEILLSGHHANIARWRREQSLRETARRRPALLQTADLDASDKKFLASLEETGEPAKNTDE